LGSLEFRALLNHIRFGDSHGLWAMQPWLSSKRLIKRQPLAIRAVWLVLGEAYSKKCVEGHKVAGLVDFVSRVHDGGEAGDFRSLFAYMVQIVASEAV